MKLNNLQKNFFTFLSVIISILIVALAWEKISLPLNNTSAAKDYSATNDTIRYIFFIGIPISCAAIGSSDVACIAIHHFV